MYRDQPYYQLSLDQIQRLIITESRHNKNSSRIFLADGNVMRRSFNELEAILKLLNEHFPKLTRISLYANGSSISTKSDDQLHTLKALKLHTLYMGLESGDEDILKRCNKGETAKQMAEAGIKAQNCGLRMSVMVLIGLGGIQYTVDHAKHTAYILNQMQPRLLSTLRVIPVKGTELYDASINNQFQLLTEYQAIQELQNIIHDLNLNSTVFRANHSSNIIPMEARFPRDKERLLAEINTLLTSNTFDKHSPGTMPLWL